MANYQELANLVWSVANDVLRGPFKEHEYGDITLPFLVLRRLDCVLDEDGRKEKAINTYNQFKDQVPEEALPPIILKAINTSFYNIELIASTRYEWLKVIRKLIIEYARCRNPRRVSLSLS